MPTAIPMRTTTLDVVFDAWMTWLTTAPRPTVASTAESASSTGMPAATNAPNASRRMTNVTGTEVSSARCRSLLDDVVRGMVRARVADLLER